VLASIRFNHDLALEIYEVEDIVSKRMLAPEFARIELPATQQLPKSAFGIGRRVA